MNNYREHINELNENLKAFPEPEEVFSPKQPWLKDHFLPCVSIDLAELNPQWKGTKLHMINPIEPYEGYIGDETTQYHNEYTSPNWLAFRLDENNHYEFLGNEGYFLRSPINKKFLEDNGFLEDLEEHAKESFEIYARKKKNFQEGEGDYKKGAFENSYFGLYLDSLGGEIEGGNWADSEMAPSAFVLEYYDDWKISITHNGNPFYQIASVAGYSYSTGADAIIMLYEPVSRIVLFSYDFS
jgi:hypothetical protein